jgi:hypothetical protein
LARAIVLEVGVIKRELLYSLFTRVQTSLTVLDGVLVGIRWVVDGGFCQFGCLVFGGYCAEIWDEEELLGIVLKSAEFVDVYSQSLTWCCDGELLFSVCLLVSLNIDQLVRWFSCQSVCLPVHKSVCRSVSSSGLTQTLC